MTTAAPTLASITFDCVDALVNEFDVVVPAAEA
jgi:hypothetical protein